MQITKLYTQPTLVGHGNVVTRTLTSTANNSSLEAGSLTKRIVHQATSGNDTAASGSGTGTGSDF
jgi:hypothetical protein